MIWEVLNMLIRCNQRKITGLRSTSLHLFRMLIWTTYWFQSYLISRNVGISRGEEKFASIHLSTKEIARLLSGNLKFKELFMMAKVTGVHTSSQFLLSHNICYRILKILNNYLQIQQRDFILRIWKYTTS